MAKIIESPVDVSIPSGYKGSGGVYNGEDTDPFSSYKRTGGSEVPEKTYDAIPGAKGDSGLAFETDKLPKNLQ